MIRSSTTASVSNIVSAPSPRNCREIYACRRPRGKVSAGQPARQQLAPDGPLRRIDRGVEGLRSERGVRRDPPEQRDDELHQPVAIALGDLAPPDTSPRELLEERLGHGRIQGDARQALLAPV